MGEHKLSVFEKRVLKKEEVKGGLRKVHNVESHNLYSSQNNITVIK
jgi:hypothetical protein